MNRINIGVDVGGTTINTGFLNTSGKIIIQNTIDTKSAQGSPDTINAIIQNIQKTLQEMNYDISDISSIGLGAPGTVDPKNGIVVFAPNIFWSNVQVAEPIVRAFNKPLYLAQDSRAAAWGEFLVGSGKGHKNIASITLGTGIGCGMILDGKLFHGGLNTAGEFGHQIVELNGYECNCGKKGCLEVYAGGLSILREGRKIPDIDKIAKKDIHNLSVRDIYSLAEKGNSYALQIAETVVNYLGIGLVNLINLNSLELISICGGISEAPDELLINPLKKFIRNRAYSAIAEKVKLVKSSLGQNAPMIGAALLCEGQGARVGIN